MQQKNPLTQSSSYHQRFCAGMRIVSAKVLAVLQTAVALFIAVAAGLTSGQIASVLSVAIGWLAVVVPSLLASWFVFRVQAKMAALAMARIAIGSLIKIGLAVAIIRIAALHYEGLRWPELIITLVVLLNLVWITVWVTHRKKGLKVHGV